MTARLPMTDEDRERARSVMRHFAIFVSRQDPEALADDVVAVDKTLAAVEALQAFFKRYAKALKARRKVH